MLIFTRVVTILPFALLALVFVYSCAAAWQRRRREAPLRDAVRARPTVMFRTSVRAWADILGKHLPVKGNVDLVVYQDIIEISHPIAVARFLFGQEWLFCAAETTIELSAGTPYDWILVQGEWCGHVTRVSVRTRNAASEIWDALARAGAQPGDLRG